MEVRVDISTLQGFLESLGYHIDTTAGSWNLMGVRSAAPTADGLLRSTAGTFDRYDDTLLVFGFKPGGGSLLRAYTCSVDPGRYWTQNPCPKKGCAHLLNGQYRYQIGIHNRSKAPAKRYTALIPASKVTVWRDTNRNFVRDGKDFVESGYFPINIHAGGSCKSVGMQSAGCQVIYGSRFGPAYSSFIELMKSASTERFWYSLVDAADIALWKQGNESHSKPPVEHVPGTKGEALQRVLEGIRLLYCYQEAANLGNEEGLSFIALLNRLRHTGILCNLELENPPSAQAAKSASEAREGLMRGFRLIYGYLLPAGLDHTFHARLNELRRFGVLDGI